MSISTSPRGHDDGVDATESVGRLGAEAGPGPVDLQRKVVHRRVAVAECLRRQGAQVIDDPDTFGSQLGDLHSPAGDDLRDGGLPVGIGDTFGQVVDVDTAREEPGGPVVQGGQATEIGDAPVAMLSALPQVHPWQQAQIRRRLQDREAPHPPATFGTVRDGHGLCSQRDIRIPKVAQRGVDDGEPVRKGAVVGLHRRQGPVHPLVEVLRPVPTFDVEVVPGQPVCGADDPSPPTFLGVVTACLEHALVVRQLHEVPVSGAPRRAGLGAVGRHPRCRQEYPGHGRSIIAVTVAHDVVLDVDSHVRPPAIGLVPVVHPDEEIGLAHAVPAVVDRQPASDDERRTVAHPVAGALLPIRTVEPTVDLHRSFDRGAQRVEHLALVGDAPGRLIEVSHRLGVMHREGDVSELERGDAGDRLMIAERARFVEQLDGGALGVLERQRLRRAGAGVALQLGADAVARELLLQVGKVGAGRDLEREFAATPLGSVPQLDRELADPAGEKSPVCSRVRPA